MQPGRASSRPRPWVRPEGVPATAVQPLPADLPRAPRAEDLAGFWLLADAPPAALAALAAATERRRYAAGAQIFNHGDPSSGLYLVASGSVRILRHADEAAVVLSVVESGDCFGEIGVIDGKPRTALARAGTASVLYFLPADPFLDVVERTPSVAMRLLGLLCARVRRTDSLAVDLSGALAYRPHEGGQ